MNDIGVLTDQKYQTSPSTVSQTKDPPLVQSEDHSAQSANLNRQDPNDFQIKRPKWKRILIVLVALLSIISFFLIILLIKGSNDTSEVQTVVTQFMESVSSGDYRKAYDLSSKNFRTNTSYSEFIDAMTVFEAHYSDFGSQEQTGFYVRATSGQPVYYEYSGSVNFLDGDVGEIHAVLVEEGDKYMVNSIEVNVGLDRLKKFKQNDQDKVFGLNTRGG